MEKIPIILDTDIGDDVDDTWAIIFMLHCPELDIKLINVALKNSVARAKMVADILVRENRTDIPIGLGVKAEKRELFNKSWSADFDLKNYAGEIVEDGIERAAEIVRASEKDVTLIAIAPLPNVSAFVEKYPELVEKINFVGMYGSVYLGYDGKNTPDPEYNVVEYIDCAQKVFSAPWKSMTVTPLDTCGLVRLTGDDFLDIKNYDSEPIKHLMECYRAWAGGYNDVQSSVLFDTVAIYLAFKKDFITLEKLNVRVDENGYTVIDDINGKPGLWATAWNYYGKYTEFLLRRLKGYS